MKDFEVAVRELIDSYRDGDLDQAAAVMALRTQADLLYRDDTWGAKAREKAAAEQGKPEDYSSVPGDPAHPGQPPEEQREEAEEESKGSKKRK